jgi:RNA polymerase sigma factor (sigma-70 family)
MGKGQPGCTLRELGALFAAGTATGLTDKELLERYKAKRTESAEAATAAEIAFAALVDRHGAMVWGVCRRLLGDAHEAEDAFQATFLVLVRKAGSVRVDGSLGRWLYAVAHRVALRARSGAKRRRSAIDRVPPPSPCDSAGEVEARDLRNVVGEELDRLPAKYRCPVELCHLQGMTYDQAARQLNWPVATVKNRLTKGRLKLRERLAQRGLAPGAVVIGMTTALTSEARAAVPPELVHSTVHAATACAIGAFPPGVTDLAEGVLKTMMWGKLKLVAIGALAAFGLGLTAQAVSQQAPSGRILTARSPQIAARPAEKSNENTVRDRRWVRSLPSGAIIEIIGVSSLPSGPNTWWRPDGTPLHPAPCDPIEHNIEGDNALRKLVLVRLARIPDGAEHHWSIAETRGTVQGPAMRDGKPLPGLSATTVLLRADADASTVRFKVAAGPWNTIKTGGQGGSGGGSQGVGTYIIGDAITTGEGTAVSVTHNIQNHSVRLVAIDDDGKELAGETRSTLDVTNFRQVEFEFDQPPEQIKEIRLQIRPYEQVEIPRIALKRK